jgi:hypothetical protein
MKISYTADDLAQMGHVLAGMLIVLGGTFLLRRLPAFIKLRHFILFPAGAAIIFAAIKEFWFDIHFETPATMKSGLKDFSFYMIGVGAALGLFYLSRHFWEKTHKPH